MFQLMMAFLGSVAGDHRRGRRHTAMGAVQVVAGARVLVQRPGMGRT